MPWPLIKLHLSSTWTTYCPYKQCFVVQYILFDRRLGPAYGKEYFFNFIPDIVLVSQAYVVLRKISGMAMRHCIELGYHRSTERYRNLVDPLTKEISKRCFWVAYDIDRVASFILGRPAGISDNAIDVEVL